VHVKGKSGGPQTIDVYIAGFPAEVRDILQQVRQTVRRAAPDAEEAISYQMPTFKLKGNLVHFAAFKSHIGLYPTPSATQAFQKELAPYKHGKGSIRFPLDQPIPYNLIERIVSYRVKENLAKAEGGARKR
jgi:uncharacterized protein YdhG (YjbR/CyaY superfamily)